MIENLTMYGLKVQESDQIYSGNLESQNFGIFFTNIKFVPTLSVFNKILGKAFREICQLILNLQFSGKIRSKF